MKEKRLQDILYPGNKLMTCQMTMELWPTGSSQALSLESGMMPGESRAAHVSLAPVLSEITGSRDHGIHGGRVHAINIPQRPRGRVADTFTVKSLQIPPGSCTKQCK